MHIKDTIAAGTYVLPEIIPLAGAAKIEAVGLPVRLRWPTVTIAVPQPAALSRRAGPISADALSYPEWEIRFFAGGRRASEIALVVVHAVCTRQSGAQFNIPSRAQGDLAARKSLFSRCAAWTRSIYSTGMLPSLKAAPCHHASRSHSVHCQ